MSRVERGQRELRKYLDGDMRERRFGGMVTEWEDYLRLFQHVRGETAVGEASAGYLWSETAARNIHAKIPNCQNPTDSAQPSRPRLLSIPAPGGRRRARAFPSGKQIEANLQNRSRKFSLQYPLLEFGLYHGQVTRFLEFIPAAEPLYPLIRRLPREPGRNDGEYLPVSGC